MRAVLLLSAAFVSTGALAQEEATEPDAGLSELEALSRTGDDPFAGVIETVTREPVSVTLRALDKITARYTDIEIPMNEIARFGSLELQPRTCDKRPPEEFPETTAFLEIFDTEYGSRGDDLKIDPALLGIGEEEAEQPGVQSDEVEVLEEFPEFGAEPEAEEPEIAQIVAPVEPPPAMPSPEVLDGPQAEGVNIFRGWMFASSPALNALEHPVYDVWVIDCTTRVVDNRTEAEGNDALR